MFLSDLSIKRPIMMTMFLLVFILFGVLAYLSLPLNLTPEIKIPWVTVTTVYPGASPDQVEEQITKPIEDEIGSLNLLDYVQSYSMDSASIVLISFDMKKDVDVASREVKDRIDAILNDLPADAEKPVVEKIDIQAFPVVQLVFSGDIDPRELHRFANTTLKDRISQVNGVGKVDVIGGREREIRVELDNRVVFQNRLSLVQLGQLLGAAGLEMPGGQFQEKSQDYSVKLAGNFASLEEIGRLEVPTQAGVKPLSDLARVVDSGKDVRERASYYNNKDKIRADNAVLLSVIKNPNGNTVRVAKEVKNLIPTLKDVLPAGTDLGVITESATFVEAAVSDTVSNIIMGIILTGLVLLIFLHDLRSTIIITLSMPASIVSTFLFLQLSGISLNIMSLMGLSTSVGILVMNSVIVLENIFRHKELGNSRRDAASIGTAEVTVAVLASTLTNLVVFLPIASMSGMAGQLFRDFALAVTFATVFSLLTGFTLTPMLAALILPEQPSRPTPIGEWLEKGFQAMSRWYSRVLAATMKSRKRSAFLIIASVVLFVGSMAMAPRIGMEFMPAMDEGAVQVKMELPEGYELAETAKAAKIVEDRAAAHPEVLHVATTLGRLSEIDTGTNMAVLDLKLVGVESRKESNSVFAARLIEELSDIPNARIRAVGLSDIGGGEEAPIDFYLVGQDIKTLGRFEGRLMERLYKLPGMTNLNSSLRPGKTEIVLRPYRDRMIKAGVTVQEVAMALRAGVEGIVVGSYKEGGDEYDIRVTLSDRSVAGYDYLRNLMVSTPQGIYPVSHFADVRYERGFSRILHKDKFKAVEITSYLLPGYDQGRIMNAIGAEVAELKMPSGYKMVLGGMSKELEKTASEMTITFIIAVVLTFMLLAAMLERIGQPILILATVPMSLIGVVWSFLATGMTLNLIAMMSIVMLVGMVVNNAILILDYSNQLMAKGMSVHDALVEACPTKLKPILMANIATIAGMIPMAMGIGSAGREFRQPMGIVSIGGVVVSTLLTLFVIPAAENLLHRMGISRKKETT